MRLFQPRMEISSRTHWMAVLFGFLIFLLAWNLLSDRYAARGQSVLFPSPASVWATGLSYFGIAMPSADQSPETAQKVRERSKTELRTLWGDIRVSFFRVTVAFLLAAIVGIPVGALIGAFRIFESFLQPVTEFIRYVPVPALIPLLIVLFGIDETPKIMLIFIGTVFQLILMVADEIRRVPLDLIQVCYTLGGNISETLTKIMLPAAMPGIFDALRLCNGWAWTWLIVAELVAANEGMGFRIVRYQRFLQTDKIFVYLIVLGLIGLLIDLVFRQFNRVLFRWADTSKR